MTTEREKTCDERIQDRMESRLDDIRNLWNEPHSNEDGYEYEDGFTALNEYGLDFSYNSDGEEHCFVWLLSTGGPHSEFRFFVNSDMSLYRIEFAFLDWWDGATRRLHGDERELMHDIWQEFFCLGGDTESLLVMVRDSLKNALDGE